MAQNWEECEISEADADTVVDFYKLTTRDRHTIHKPFRAVLKILQGAGWQQATPLGYDVAGNAFTRLLRRLQSGRAVDDTLDVLR